MRERQNCLLYTNSNDLAPRQRSNPLMRTQDTAFQKTHIEWLVDESACERDSCWSGTNNTKVGLDDRIFRYRVRSRNHRTRIFINSKTFLGMGGPKTG